MTASSAKFDASANAAARTAPTTGLWIGVAAILAIYIWLFYEFLSRQVRWAFREPADWGHTLVIPLIAGYFVYLKREELFARKFRTTWFGLAPVALGVGWYMLCALGPQPLLHHNLMSIGPGLALFGILLLFCGWRPMPLFLFPLVYLGIFGQSISYNLLEIITFRLQDITAFGSEKLLFLSGMEVDRAGNTLMVYHPGQAEPQPLNIAEACSGMRMLMAFLALGVAMAYTSLKRIWQRGLLIALAIPTAVFVNILRVCTLAWLTRWDVDFAAGDFHTFIGLVWLLPAFFLYLGFIWMIRQMVVEAPTRSGGRKGGDE